MKPATAPTTLLCPNGCKEPMNCNAVKNGMKVRLCVSCGHSWIANPVLDLLQQDRASSLSERRNNERMDFSPAQVSSLDQVKEQFRSIVKKRANNEVS